jgi:hypothetical protein
MFTLDNPATERQGRTMRVCLVLAAALAAGGCAFNNPANTPLLTALDGAVQPESTAAKVALGPVFVPVGVTCGVLDICVVHPAQSVPRAASDAWRVVWKNAGGSFTQQSLLFVPRVVTTPVVFCFAWARRSLFDVNRPHRGMGAQ